jgi:hypothetical protein
MAGIDSKEWSLEEGLIHYLRILAGETRLESNPESSTPIESGDLVVMARAYLLEGSDEDAKAEIRRLLNAVDISIEDMMRYSVPVDIDQGGARLEFQKSIPSQLLAGLIPVAMAQEPPGCIELWRGGVHTDAQPPGECFGVYEWQHRGYTHRIFFPLPWARNSNPNLEFARSARSAINLSLDTYVMEMGLRVNSVNLHFLEGESDKNFLAEMWPEGTTFTSRSECRVRAFASSYAPDSRSDYAQGGSADLDKNFRQVMAHEVFHCIQLWNLRPQMYGAPGLGLIERGAFEVVRKWWSEGSAEYFSNVVYPCNQLEWVRLLDFNERAADYNIFQLTYENTFLFQHLGNALGNSGVFEILQAMPSQGSVAFQMSAVDRTAVAQQFHFFGRHYMDNSLMDSCVGEPDSIPGVPRIENLPIFNGVLHEFETTSYKLNMKQFVFAPGNMQLEYKSAGAEAQDAYDNFGSGGWTKPPESVNATCDAAAGVLLVTLADTSNRLSYSIRETGSPPPIFQEDRCLIGNWQSTAESARDIALWVAANPLTKPNVASEMVDVSGTIRGVVEPGGRVSGSMDDFQQKYISQIKIGKKTISNASTITTNGATSGMYSADGSLLTVWGICTESTAHATVEMDGRVISDMDIDLQAIASSGSIPGMEKAYYDFGGPKPESKGLVANSTEMPSEFNFTYRCRGNTLEIDPPPKMSREGNRPPWVFSKR